MGPGADWPFMLACVIPFLTLPDRPRTEPFEEREKRGFALSVLDSPEHLMMYAQSTGDVSVFLSSLFFALFSPFPFLHTSNALFIFPKICFLFLTPHTQSIPGQRQRFTAMLCGFDQPPPEWQYPSSSTSSRRDNQGRRTSERSGR